MFCAKQLKINGSVVCTAYFKLTFICLCIYVFSFSSFYVQVCRHKGLSAHSSVLDPVMALYHKLRNTPFRGRYLKLRVEIYQKALSVIVVALC